MEFTNWLIAPHLSIKTLVFPGFLLLSLHHACLARSSYCGQRSSLWPPFWNSFTFRLLVVISTTEIVGPPGFSTFVTPASHQYSPCLALFLDVSWFAFSNSFVTHVWRTPPLSQTQFHVALRLFCGTSLNISLVSCWARILPSACWTLVTWNKQLSAIRQLSSLSLKFMKTKIKTAIII